MALAETQELVARLRLDTSQFNSAIRQVGAASKALESQMSSVARSVTSAIGAETAALRARAAEMEKIAAQSTLVGSGGRAPITRAAQQAAAAEAAALRNTARAIEDNAAAATIAMNERFAQQKALALNEANWTARQAAASKRAYAERGRLAQAFWDEEKARIAAAAAAQSRYNDLLADQRAQSRARIGRVATFGRDVGVAAATGGLTFLKNTVLATAAAGAVLELQFVRIQDAQAALARTLHGESAAGIARLNDQIMEISKTVPLAITELYRIAEVIGTTGIATDSIDELTTVVAKMAAVTDLSADEAAISIARLLNMFGQLNDDGQIAAGAAENLADAIFRASISFASSDQEIIRAVLRFGALAESMHITQGAAIALAGAVTGLGQEPEAVGGSFQRTFQIINKAIGQYDKGIDDGIEATKKFAELAGMSSEAFAAGIKSTEPDVAFKTFIELIEGFSKLSPTEQAVLFGKGGVFPSFVRGAQTLQNLGLEWEKVLAAASEYNTTTGAFEEAFAKRVDTLAKNFQLLLNAIGRGAFAFGEAFDKQLGGAIKRVTDYITENEGKFTEWGVKVGRAIESIDWLQVKNFVKDFFGVFAFGVKTTGDVLDLLGPKLTGMIALLGTVNALSGGAIGTVAKLFGSGAGAVIQVAFDRYLARGSSPANPLHVVGPGMGVGPGGGGGIVNTVMKVFMVGIAAEALNELSKPVVDTLNEWFGTNFQGGTDPGAFIHNINEAGELIYDAAKETALSIHDLLGTGHGHPGAGGGLLSPFSGGGAGGRFGEGPMYGPTLEQLGALAVRQGDLQEETNAILNRGVAAEEAGLQTLADLTRKLIDALKPEHRRGEVGKSIETAAGRRLRNLDINDANFAAKLAAYVDHLVKHYTEQPIGTPGHSRAFVTGNLDPIERALGRELRQALREGNADAARLLAEKLRSIGAIPKNDLPGWVERLVRKAEAQTQATEETKGAVQKAGARTADKLANVNDRIENLTAALRRKRLSVGVRVAPANFKAGNVYVTTRVTSVIGRRNLIRSTRYVAYGPSYTVGGSGSYSLYGPQPE